MERELDTWLRAIGLVRYAETFRDNAIEFDLVAELTEADLEAMGVLLGHRKRFFKALAERDAAAQAPRDAVPKTLLPGERREVSVLFADLAGFTALSAKLGAEATHDFLQRFFAAVDRVVESYGGTVDKHIGDNVMAVFGAPVAHDDDPERAVRAALDSAAADSGTGALDQCRAWIGVASCARLAGDYEAGMAALDRAEPLVEGREAPRDVSEIAYYRGCLIFSRGDATGCLTEHRTALEAAVEARDPACEASALSGLGDGYYGLGAMQDSFDSFQRCRDICRAHGFGGIEVGSTMMIGNIRRYLNDFAGGIADVREAVEMAIRVSAPRPEMVGSLLLGEYASDQGDFAAAHRALDQAVVLGRRLPSAFILPRTLAAWALAGRSAAERRAALAEGEAILATGPLFHVVAWFYRDAIEAALAARDWDEAERYAGLLAGCRAGDPGPWAALFVARGRLLAAAGRGIGDKRTARSLRALRDEFLGIGLRTPVRELDAANNRPRCGCVARGDCAALRVGY